MNLKRLVNLNALVCFLCLSFAFLIAPDLLRADEKPNVILIVCDDLNDYVEGFGGHPQSHTPNIARLAKSGVSFKQAHCNIPICGPSRASMFTGIYPHHSGCYGFDRWDGYEVLKNSRTIMDHFRANGYHTLGAGKLMHQLIRQEWSEYGNASDYGPFAFDGKERVAHPEVPAPYRDIGAIDGSFGPLVSLKDRKFADDKSYIWQTGSWGKVHELTVGTDDKNGMTADELNGQWAVKRLNELADRSSDKPFFMGVGFIRPHTPLIVPQRFFDMFPLDSIELPLIKPGDVDDTHARSVRGDASEKEPDAQRTNDMGTRLFDSLVASYDSKEVALKHFIQAYLASVASVDEQIGKILDTVDNSKLKENTIIVITSDHGWGMGEKDYLYKNSLWQESTRVPLIVHAPGIAKAGGIAEHPVSLIDLYPTLIDLCGLTGDTKKNEKGHALDGHSLKPFLKNPQTKEWSGPDAALTALYKWARAYDPSEQSYSLRTKDWRYIRYSNSKEELYHTAIDPHEWENLASNSGQKSRLTSFRKQLAATLPAPGTAIQKAKPEAEVWKNKYFSKHPNADTNNDGKLSWPELKTHKAKLDSKKAE